jgi:hypothetical protein
VCITFQPTLVVFPEELTSVDSAPQNRDVS